MTTDAWDVSNGTTVAITSGMALLGAPTDVAAGSRMFGATVESTETTNAIFEEFKGQGFVHFIEWTNSAKTILSFNLSAGHDGHPNSSANNRGFSRFTLYACATDCTVPNRTLLYDLNPVPVGNDNDAHPDENALLYDPTGAFGAFKNVLEINDGVLAAVSASRWRAELVQFGPDVPGSPRVYELDGFLTSYQPPLDIDGNGAYDPLTDGLLFLRFRFGFTGTTLTSGAVGSGCTRCDAGPIQAFLAALGLKHDIDGNGSLEPLTDGLLALRFLFGFTGSTLTTGVVGQGCARCTSPPIAVYLQSLM